MEIEKGKIFVLLLQKILDFWIRQFYLQRENKIWCEKEKLFHDVFVFFFVNRIPFDAQTRMSAQSDYDWSAEGPARKKFFVR